MRSHTHSFRTVAHASGALTAFGRHTSRVDSCDGGTRAARSASWLHHSMLLRLLNGLAAATMALPLALHAQSAGEVRVVVGASRQAFVAPGAVLTVPFAVDMSAAGALDVASLSARFAWDTTRLRFDSSRVVPVEDFTTLVNRPTPDTLALSAFNGSGTLRTSATFARLYFTARETLGGAGVQVRVTAAGNEIGASILSAIRVQPLAVCVAPEGRWGDANADGIVNIIDAQQIARFTVGLSVANAVALEARGDVTADGSVNIIDAQQIARFTVGLAAAARINTLLYEPPAVTAVGVTPASAQTVAVGGRLALVAEAQDAAGAPLGGCVPITWASSNTSVATVTDAGEVVGVAAGTAVITASAGGQSASVTVTVGNGETAGTVLVLTTQPTGATSNEFLSVQPVVELRDSTGSVITSADRPVTVAIASGDGVLSGPVTVPTVNGVASFADLAITGVGAHTLRFSATDVADAISQTVTMAEPSGIRVLVGDTPAIDGVAGEVVEIPLRVDFSGNTSGRNLAALGVTLTWDPEQYEFVSDMAGEWVDDAGGAADITVNTTNTDIGAFLAAGFTTGETTQGFLLRTVRLRPLQTGPVVLRGGVGAAGDAEGIAVALSVRQLTSTRTPPPEDPPGFSGQDLSRRDFAGFDFSGLAFVGTNLSFVRMPDARFVGSNLTNAFITWSNIRGVDFFGATLTGVQWDNSQFDAVTRWPSGFTPTRQLGLFGPGLTYDGEDLSGRDFAGFDFSGASMIGTRFSGVRMPDARFTNANLTNAKVLNSNIGGVDFTGATVTGVEWTGSGFSSTTKWPDGFDPSGKGLIGPGLNYDGVDFSGRDFAGVQFSGGSFIGTNFTGVRMPDARFVSANLTGAILSGSNIRGVEFTGATLTDVVWTGAGFSSTTKWPVGFDPNGKGLIGPGLNYDGVDFSGRDFAGVEFRGASFVGANFTNVRMPDADMRNTNVRGTNFTNANIAGVLFTGALYDAATVWPNGFDPAAAGAILVAGGWQSLSAGSFHVCGITSAGGAYCWGYNYRGQLGDGTESNRSAPTPLAGGRNYKAMSGGEGHSCGVETSGLASCWGYNTQSQLGDGSAATRATPASVAGGREYVTVVTGGFHSCGLSTSGAAYCWGGNGDGQLGDGSFVTRSTPVAVEGGRVFRSLIVGFVHSCGLDASGVAYCWGQNTYGQLGDGTTANRLLPTAVASGSVRFSQLVAGRTHTCGRTATNEMYCWGRNEFGQLGDGTTTDRSTPTRVTGDRLYMAMTAGSNHSCAIDLEGAAYCWGRNDQGWLGDGSTTPRAVPTPVVGTTRFQSLAAGDWHTCGISTTGGAYCWGQNTYGQLGDGTEINRAAPTPVLLTEPVSARR